jgi:hypothetical protein
MTGGEILLKGVWGPSLASKGRRGGALEESLARLVWPLLLWSLFWAAVVWAIVLIVRKWGPDEPTGV